MGLFQDPKEKKKRAQTEAEDWAMDMLKKHAPDLKLFGARGRGNSKSAPVDIPPPPDKDIGITFKGFTFPDDSRKPRVNWGENLSFNLSVFNKTSEAITGKVSLRILKGDAPITVLINDIIEIEPHNSDCRIKDTPFILDIDESDFSEKGQYRILARLFDENGSELHKLSKPFWVEQDPPENSAPFQIFGALLDEPLAWKIFDEDIGIDPKFYYNTEHPEYKKVDDENDGISRREHVLKLCLEGVVHFILSRPVDGNSEDLYAPLDTDIIRNGDPAQIHKEAMKYIAQIRWNIYQGGDA